MYIELNSSNNRRTRSKALKIFYIFSLILGLIMLEIVFAYTYHRFGATDYSAVVLTKEEGDPNSVVGINGYLEDYEDGTLTVRISNINDIDVRLISIHDEDNSFNYPFQGNTIIQPNKGELVYHSYTLESVDQALLEDKTSIYIRYSYSNNIEKEIPLIPYKLTNDEVHNSTTIRAKDNREAFNFIIEDDQALYFMGDNITIDKPMYLSTGKPLTLAPGQTIDLIHDAYIVSYAPIQAIGEKDQPITVYSSDSTGRGLYICQAKGKSHLESVTFDGLNTPKSGIWGLTGAVTFYQSDVNIIDCTFENNTCEDGLNIIDSTFSIQNCTFKNTFGDAFDADFCEGTIKDCLFKDTGNDGLDISTTQLEADTITFQNIGDKGISCGENSNLHMQNIIINKAQIGLASKDLSTLTGTTITIQDAVIAATLYQKKPEFGPATIDISDVTLRGDIDLNYLIEENSNLFIDHTRIPPKMASKESLLFEKIINGESLN